MKKKYLLLFLPTLVLAIALCYASIKLYHTTCRICIEDMEVALVAAIEKEKTERWNRLDPPTFTSYDTKEEQSDHFVIQTESDTIVHRKADTAELPFDEFFEKSQFSYLALKYPVGIQQLDSIYNDELKKRGIATQTAIIYTYKDTTPQTSRSDSAFFASSYRTTEIVLGASNEIKVQGLAQLSAKVIISKNLRDWALIATFGLIIMVGCTIWMVRLGKPKPVPVLTVEDNEETPKGGIIELTDIIQFNDDMRIEMTFNRQPIKLTETTFKCLKMLYEAHDYFLTYDKLITGMYGEIIGGQKRLIQVVNRIRKEVLISTPEITIENVYKKGYRLIIKEKQKA